MLKRDGKPIERREVPGTSERLARVVLPRSSGRANGL